MKSPILFRCLPMLALAVFAQAAVAEDETKIWTDPGKAAQEDPDFLIQGEYAGADVGVQVVAMGDGKFYAYILDGGLPGLGWTPEKSRAVLKGDKDALTGEDGKISASIRDGKFIFGEISLPRIERKSPTLGAPAPEGAVVLFDGSSADAWVNGKMEDGLLLATGCTSKQSFKGYRLHLEFRTPYKPFARGQQRGNSGVYHSGRWETQVLDSFGLEGKDNETGGIYSISEPRLNMCLPPLAWQTYDVDFTAAKFDAEGKRTAWPRITVKLNGVLVHEDLELNKDFTTSAPNSTPLTSPEGPIFLQEHGNPVVYRNIWVMTGE